jgi:putative protease
VTRVYRAALDAYVADPAGWHYDPRWRDELDKVSHRPYDSGFLFGGSDARIHAGDSRYRRACDFVGSVEEVLPDGSGWVGARNRFFSGEVLELLGPAMRQSQFAVSEVSNGSCETVTTIQPNARVRMPLPRGAAPGDLLRRNKEENID